MTITPSGNFTDVGVRWVRPSDQLRGGRMSGKNDWQHRRSTGFGPCVSSGADTFIFADVSRLIEPADQSRRIDW